jgi:hypothetical protein
MVLIELSNKQLKALRMMSAIFELQNYAKYRAHDVKEIKQMILNNIAC